MKLKITVHGVAYEVDVEVLDATDEMHQPVSALPPIAPQAPSGGGVPLPPPAGRVPKGGPAPSAGDGNGVASPIAGTVLEVKVKVGDQVTAGQDLLIIEAMKMETAIAAPSAGVVTQVLVAAGDAVRESQSLIEMDS